MTTRVLVVEYSHAWVGSDLVVVVRTDVPCHGWLRWTDTPARMHLRGSEARGLLVKDNPKYCFVSWTEVEQAQAGDTEIHTFTFGPWTAGDCKWWHWRWTVAGQPSPSNTGIWNECYGGNQSVLSLGILGDPVLLYGAAKLTPTANVSLTFDMAQNAIVVAGA